MAFRRVFASTVHPRSCVGCGQPIKDKDCWKISETEKFRKIGYECNSCQRKGKISINKEKEKGMKPWDTWPT